jgi:hypothetical protein
VLLWRFDFHNEQNAPFTLFFKSFKIGVFLSPKIFYHVLSS